MATPKLDNRKGCFYNETIEYRALPDDVQLMPVSKIRFRNVATDEMTRREMFTTSHFVARLLLNLGHWVM